MPGLSASLLAGGTARFPQLFPGPGQQLTKTTKQEALKSQRCTSPQLAGVQVQLWVQCRSLTLTLVFYSKKEKPLYARENRPKKRSLNIKKSSNNSLLAQAKYKHQAQIQAEHYSIQACFKLLSNKNQKIHILIKCVSVGTKVYRSYKNSI